MTETAFKHFCFAANKYAEENEDRGYIKFGSYSREISLWQVIHANWNLDPKLAEQTKERMNEVVRKLGGRMNPGVAANFLTIANKVVEEPRRYKPWFAFPAEAEG